MQQAEAKGGGPVTDPRYDDEASENENLCSALYAVADAIRSLGLGNVHGPGPLEFLGMTMRDDVAGAIQNGLDGIATAIEQHE